MDILFNINASIGQSFDVGQTPGANAVIEKILNYFQIIDFIEIDATYLILPCLYEDRG